MDYPNPNKNYDIHERLGIQIVENHETDTRRTQRDQVRRQSKVSTYSEHISGQVSIAVLLNPTAKFHNKKKHLKRGRNLHQIYYSLLDGKRRHRPLGGWIISQVLLYFYNTRNLFLGRVQKYHWSLCMVLYRNDGHCMLELLYLQTQPILAEATSGYICQTNCDWRSSFSSHYNLSIGSHQVQLQ